MSEYADFTSGKSYYDGIGHQYDIVTRVQRYEVWVRMYADLIERHGVQGKTLLDIGCGTGKSALGLAELGFQVTGVDFSEEMLGIARAKPGADLVNFVLADARALPSLGLHAAATTMGEPFCHLSSTTDLVDCFRGVERCLEPGGIFVFDLPTVGFLDRLAESCVIDDADDVVILSRGAAVTADDHTVDLTVDTFTKAADENWRRVSEVLRYHHFSPEQVERCLDSAGLRLETAYGLFKGALEESVDQELHRKSVVIARKTFRPAIAV